MKGKRLTSFTLSGLKNSRFLQSMMDASKEAGSVLLGAKDKVDELSGGIIDTAESSSDLIPGMTALKSYAAERPQRLYDTMKSVAQKQRLDAEVDFLPTNR